MKFYLVAVASKSHRGFEPLTYQSDAQLELGTVVLVPLRKSTAPGIVLATTSKPRFATKSIIRSLTDTPLPMQTRQLLSWLVDFYPAPLGAIAQLFVPRSLMRSPKASASTTAPRTATRKELPPLTREQAQAVKRMDATHGTYVLHGVTGSGKTRVYLELAKQSLAAGQSVLVLTPEIGLTPQMVKSFQTVFGDRVVTGHSTLTDVERRNLWLKTLHSQEPLVVIGPRSVLFYPLKNIGLVIVDESHEAAYKQEQAPHYRAIRVAAKLAELHKARLVMGSATPAVEDYYIAKAKQIPIIPMKQLAASQAAPVANTVVIDMREKANLSRLHWLSNDLLEALHEVLRNQEQALLFLNRRGSARLVLCQVCGWQALCPHCDIPLTYHADRHQVRCHSCGHRDDAPNQCPVCKSPDIIFRSIGTKALADELHRLFPKARIRRFDTDNPKAERFEAHYESVRSGEVDILVGTQILTKGLDLPRLSLVGIVAADSSLHFPDFSAEERTYQLISQALGRINRGHRPGKAIIQTYTPENPTIMAAARNDWDSFYTQIVKERQAFGWPPFRYLLQLTTRKASSKSALGAANKLKADIESRNLPVEIIGPSPSFHEKLAGKYQWQLVIKAKRRADLLSIIPRLPSGWTYNIDPLNLL